MNHYIRQSLCAFAVLATLVALFNIWADPYNIYRFHSADTNRMSRIGQGLSMRLSKPWQVGQRKATAAIIGSSRSGSIPPTYGLWQEKNGFNLSMAGLTLYEMQRTIEHAQAHGPLTELVIGLEYETFISGDYDVGLGFSENRLAPWGSADFYSQGLQDFLYTAFTISALTRSIMALNRRKPVTNWYFPDGRWENESRVWRGESGYVSVGKNMARLSKGAPSIYSGNLAALSDILRYCHQQNISVTLFISPEHIFLTGLRNTIAPLSNWEEFHQDLKNINLEIAGQYNHQPFPLWGFNHLTGIVNEPLPAGDIAPGAWFRDGIHFHGKLGALLMEQMLGDSHYQAFDLRRDSVDDYLESVDNLREKFFSENKTVVRRYLDKIL